MTQAAGNTPLPEFTQVVIGGPTTEVTFHPWFKSSNSDDYWSGFYSHLCVHKAYVKTPCPKVIQNARL